MTEATAVRSPSFWQLQAGVWCAAASVRLAFSERLLEQLNSPDAAEVVLWSLVWASVGFIVSSVLAVILERVPGRLRSGRLVGVVLACAVLGGLAWAAALEATGALGGRLWLAPGRAEWPWAPFNLLLLRGSLLFGAWSGVFLSWVLDRRVAEARERALQADARLHASRLELLRQQLNPHFLFNALNSLVALVDEDPARAQEMTRVLAKMLRRALAPTEEGLVPLHEELDLVRMYLGFERLRFEEKLRVEFEVAEAAEGGPVPVFLLQPLVENAVKHGMNGGRVPLVVVVRARREDGRLVLSVSNTGRLGGAAGPAPAGGLGLRNVRERLAAAFPRTHRLEVLEKDGWVTARVEYDPGEITAP
jgi:hypothetical protein